MSWSRILCFCCCLLVALLSVRVCANQQHNGSYATSHRNTHRFRGSKELCTDVKNYPGKANGAFITRDPGHWRHLPDGSMTYEVSSCTLKRFTAMEARRCLAAHNTLMIGDSLMRYQFLGLTYFIEHGHWPARFAMANKERGGDPAKDCKYFDITGKPTCSAPGYPSIVSENDWANVYGHDTDKSWRYMHQFIGGEGLRGHVECQCARSDADRSTEIMFYEHSFEAQHIAKATKQKEVDEESTVNKNDTDANRVRLSFISNLGSVKVHMWNRTFCERTASCNLTADNWYNLQGKANNHSWDVNEDLTEFISKWLPKIVPDVDTAIFNAGLWGGGDGQSVKNVMERLFSLVKPNKGRCYWKGMSPAWSTNANGYPDKFAADDNENRIAAYNSGCGVFDVRHVTKQFASFQWMGDLGRDSCCGEKEMMVVYFDAAHFQPWVNEELNQILLNQLC